MISDIPNLLWLDIGAKGSKNKSNTGKITLGAHAAADLGLESTAVLK